MHPKNTYRNNVVVRFRRWSRKGYAVFAGLNKVISIGSVSVGICNAALSKAKNRVRETAERHLLTASDENEQEEASEAVLINNNLPLLNVYTAVAAVSFIPFRKQNKNRKNINCITRKRVDFSFG